MASVDKAAATAYMKQRFSRRQIENLSFSESVAVAKIPKDESFGGLNVKMPLFYGDLAARSRTFSRAQANKGGTSEVAFTIDTKEDYALFSVRDKDIKESKGDVNAWLPILERNAKSATRALARSLAVSIYRDSTGGVASTTTTTGTTLTLANRSDIQNLEKGMYIQFADSAGAALRSSGARRQITGVAGRSGSSATITVDSTVSGLGLSTGDLIIPEGDFGVGIDGFKAWVPDADPGATLFNGVDRTPDVNRLGGLRLDAVGMPIVEAVNQSIAIACENGARPSVLFVNYDIWRKLANQLTGKIEFCQTHPVNSSGEAMANISFDGFKFHGGEAVVEVYPDRHCLANHGYLLQLDTWVLWSTGPVPHVLEEDGQMILRETTDAAYEGRMGAYYNLACSAPGYNLVLTNLGQ